VPAPGPVPRASARAAAAFAAVILLAAGARDAAVSGSIREYGLHYTAGVYNLADQRYEVPVSSTFAGRTMIENGRTFLVDLTGTYP
jgi:hypothetical protein